MSLICKVRRGGKDPPLSCFDACVPICRWYPGQLMLVQRARCLPLELSTSFTVAGLSSALGHKLVE